MTDPVLYGKMTPRQVEVVKAVRKHAEGLLNCSPRFKLFTLHGTTHLTNLFKITDILIRGGIDLNGDEIYLLSLAICIHDLGMVVGLKDFEIKQLLQGKPEAPEPAVIENEIREVHHNLVDTYIAKHLTFLADLGVSPDHINQVSAISKCHRKVVLQKQYGLIKYLGALLRVIDELDVGPERAPFAILTNLKDEMDATSLWHWVRHNIVEGWVVEHNVSYTETNSRRSIEFSLITHPSNSKSSPYWLYQIRRPIQKALADDGCAKIIEEKFGVRIHIQSSSERSTVSSLGPDWAAIEERALTGGRKVVILIDDEVRIMEDLMLPISLFAHVMYGHDAEDAFSKLAAVKANLAIVDMQISGLGFWSPDETDKYKTTGIHIIKKLKKDYPEMKIGVLTGTRYDVSELTTLGVTFVLRKPCDPDVLVKEVRDALA